MRMTNQPLVPRSLRGFSLIELMVAITLGLIVMGSLVTFTVSMVSANSANIRMTRLTQDLRTSMNIATREVRRSGYDSGSVNTALTSNDPSGYLDLEVDEANSCVTYTYDRGDATTESRGFRLGAGALQMKVGSGATPISCTSADGWENVSDPNVVTITEFTPRLFETRFCGELGEYKDETGTDYAVLARGGVRTLAVCVKGNLNADPGISRHVGDLIRLRAEELDFNDMEPVGTECTVDERAADTIVTVEDWNQECAG